MEKVSCSAAFEEKGLLEKVVKGFSPRPVQQELAAAIEKIIAEQSLLIAEAGTGTGKTYAYLVPALLSGKKILISTGTKALQDQLFHRDLPIIRKALGLPGKMVLLKGRANYLCKYKLEQGGETSLYPSLDIISKIETVRRHAPRTRLGEISEIDEIPEDSAVWPYVTSTAESCLGQECVFYNDCYLFKARRKAMDADIIVVNHHLFFADILLKDEKMGELLPQVDVIILDEAHQLPDIASRFFGERLGSRQLFDLVHDILQEKKDIATDMAEISVVCEELKTAISDIRTALGESGTKAPWATICMRKELQSAIEKVRQLLQCLIEELTPAQERSKGFENCLTRVSELAVLFNRLTGKTPPDQIHWYETFTQSFSVYFTPMSIAEQFQAVLAEKKRAWIFTSATLAVDHDFKHFEQQMGLNTVETDKLCLKSPFNYQTQAMLYVPRDMPDPNHKQYTMQVLEKALPLITLCGGRTFLLFTSHAALRMAEEHLKKVISYPILVQGSLPKERLLEKFRKAGNAVLLATGSFWEGVDVRGDALSCVIIDKLPFGRPDDPVLKARMAYMRKQQLEPFQHFQLPQAVIALKQGAGRLIRDVTDRGILMICDPRIVARDYGLSFIESLPDMPRTRDFAKLEVFWKATD